MPCQDYQSNDDYNFRQTQLAESKTLKLKKRADELSAYLCYLCTTLTEQDQTNLITDNSKLNDWWIDHQEEDRKEAVRVEKRKQSELTRKRKKAQDKKDRLSALAKLSPKERKLLDLT